ncbi:MAG: putative toxin-antitoxin system toxin component, PIN family [Parasporobacterium sp.]|nr:putative toxin-antitoxin system toxin component, PIN family [Parasporobacterium sp.]
MKCCAVVDTNVLVAALLSKRDDSATVRVIRAMISGEFVPLYHEDILAEYEDVLHRKKKYDLSESAIQTVLNAIRRFGIEIFPKPTGEIFIDEDDIIFYEVAMEKRDDNAYLVTGNMKHYPVRDFIVTPAEMVAILEEQKAREREENK